MEQNHNPDFLDIAELRIIKDNGLRAPIMVMCVVPGSLAATGANYTTSCFIADRDYYVISIIERHDALGTDAGAVACDVLKAASGTDIGSGTSLISSTFNLKATADTNQTGTLVESARTISKNQSIGLESSGTLTAVSGVTVAIKLRAL